MLRICVNYRTFRGRRQTILTRGCAAPAERWSTHDSLALQHGPDCGAVGSGKSISICSSPGRARSPNHTDTRSLSRLTVRWISSVAVGNGWLSRKIRHRDSWSCVPPQYGTVARPLRVDLQRFGRDALGDLETGVAIETDPDAAGCTASIDTRFDFLMEHSRLTRPVASTSGATRHPPLSGAVLPGDPGRRHPRKRTIGPPAPLRQHEFVLRRQHPSSNPIESPHIVGKQGGLFAVANSGHRLAGPNGGN